MSVGISNVMLRSFFFFTTRYSAVTKVGELIEEFNKTTIKSFIIGISQLKYHSLNKNIAHTALFLSNKKKGKYKTKTEGILIEYGSYPPDEEKAKKEEEDYIREGHVIYRYGDKEGGIRYYTNTFEEFLDKFCDVGCVILNLKEGMSFSYFIDQIAPIYEKKWIKQNYNFRSFNCQTFTSHCIDAMKPEYDITFIEKGKNSPSISDTKKESIVPDNVLKTLKKYEDNDD